MFGLKYPPKPLRLEDCYKKPKSSSICSDTQSEKSEDDNIIVDPGWDDFCLTSAKLPRMEAHRLEKKTRRHITYDVCFCKECLEEKEDLKYEPLNAQKRSNKPKNKKKQKWSTLGEPSGKWDYYVRYDSTQPTIPIEEVAATGWGEEFEDEDQTPTTKFT
ncbi:hypothetical protein Tco_1325418, partial [Tanacetum coccineum]